MADTSGAPTPTFEPVRPAATRASNTAAAPSRHGSSLRRSPTRGSYKEMTRDPNLDVNLPYRTFSADANLEEYTTEQPSGEMEGPVAPDGSRYKLVAFRPNDPENPKNWSKAYKWYCTVS